MQTMADAKSALKHVFETATTYLSDIHKEKSAKDTALHELKDSYSQILEQLQQKEQLLQEERKKIKQVEIEYNDKVSYLT